MAEDAAAKKNEAKASSTPLIAMMLTMVVTVLGSIGGALFWLTKSGRLPAASAAQVAPAAPKPEAPKTKLIALEPLLVNLADTGGNGYLRLVMVLRVDQPEPVKGEAPRETKPPEKGKVEVNEDDVMVRDTALAVLGRETTESLLAPEGKDRLKDRLREAITQHVKSLKVEEVMFTEFLVQR